MDRAISDLKEQVKALRDCGAVTFEVVGRSGEASGEVGGAIDGFVAQYGFVGLGAWWREVDEEQAEAIVRYILHKDLAYHSEIMAEETARELATRFIGLFSGAGRYFTNGTFAEPHKLLSGGVIQGASWTPITGATFDTGIVRVGNNRIGILWVQDED